MGWLLTCHLQAKLAGAFVVVVGCGASGSHAAHMIARAGWLLAADCRCVNAMLVCSCSSIRLVDPAGVTVSGLRAHATAASDQLGVNRAIAVSLPPNTPAV